MVSVEVKVGGDVRTVFRVVEAVPGGVPRSGKAGAKRRTDVESMRLRFDSFRLSFMGFLIRFDN